MVEDQVGVEREESERSWGGNIITLRLLRYPVPDGPILYVIYVFPLRCLF